MDIKKLAPWNWFKKEEEESGAHVPVKMKDSPSYYPAESGAANIVARNLDINAYFS